MLKCEQGSRTKQFVFVVEADDTFPMTLDVGIPNEFRPSLGFVMQCTDASADGVTLNDVEALYSATTGLITITEGATAFAVGDEIKILTWFYSPIV